MEIEVVNLYVVRCGLKFRTVAIVALTLCTTAIHAAPAGRVTDGVRIHATMQSTKVAAGSAMVVIGSLTNERPGRMPLATTDPLGGFRVAVTGPGGHPVHMNASGRDLLKLVHRSKQQLAPGEKLEQSLWLSSLYDLKKPGKYTVTMMHDVPASNGVGNVTVKSEAVTVVVTKG